MNEMESAQGKKVLRVGIYLRLSNEDREMSIVMKIYLVLELIDLNLKD